MKLCYTVASENIKGYCVLSCVQYFVFSNSCSICYLVVSFSWTLEKASFLIMAYKCAHGETAPWSFTEAFITHGINIWICLSIFYIFGDLTHFSLSVFSNVHCSRPNIWHPRDTWKCITKGQTALCIIHLRTSIALKSSWALNQQNCWTLPRYLIEMRWVILQNL